MANQLYQTNPKMKKLLLACVAMLAFACSSDDDAKKQTEIVADPDPVPVVCNGDYEGNAVLTSQAEVDAFADNNYCGVNGDLIIGYTDDNGASDITSIEGLESIKTISGTVTISNNPELANFKGLNNVEQMLNLNVIKNNKLVNLTGLESLKAIGSSTSGGEVTVYSNPLFVNFQGFGPVTQLSELWLILNPQATDFKGLEHLETILRGINIYSSDALVSLEGLSGLKHTGSLNVEGAPLLGSLQGMANIKEIGAMYLNITALKNLKGLEKVTTMTSILVAGSPLLITLEGLQNVKSTRELSIGGNLKLTSIAHLSALTTITGNNGGTVIIVDNPLLQSLDGLQNIVTCDGDISIWGNGALVNFCALKDFLEIGNFSYKFEIFANIFNPTRDEIIAGNCSQ